MGVLDSDQFPGGGYGRGLAQRSPVAPARAESANALRRRAGSTLLAAASAACLWLALDSAPALALIQRGHVFSGTIACPTLAGPTGMAVNESSGVVYVADRSTNSVVMFKPKLGSECTPTNLTAATPTLVAPEAVAVDNSEEPGDLSKGDVYVLATTQENLERRKPKADRVFKYGPEGTLITVIERTGLTAIRGLAVDAKGALFLYGEGVLEGTPSSLISRFTNASPVNKRHGRIESRAPGATTHAFAVDAEGNFYVGHVSGESTPATAKLNAAGVVLNGQLDTEPTKAVAVSLKDVEKNLVNEKSDAYLANATTIGSETTTTLAAFDREGSLVQHVLAKGMKEAGAIAPDPSTGNVYLAAPGEVGVFSLEGSGAPRVDALSGQPVQPPEGATNAIRLSARIDPHGVETKAYFEYGPTSCESSTCTKTATKPVGGGFGDVEVNEEIQNLRPGNYFFRVTAENADGSDVIPQQTIAIIENLSSGLPDGRGWEMVSPPTKGGFEPEAIVASGGTIQAAANGSAISYVADGPFASEGQRLPEGNRSPEATQILSYRGGSSWVTQDITTAAIAGEGIREGSPQEYQAFSPNLSLALLQPFIGFQETSPFAQPPLSPKQEFEVNGKVVTEREQEKTIYIRADAPLPPEGSEKEDYEAASINGATMHNPGFLAVLTEANALGVLGGTEQGQAQFGGGVEAGISVMIATPDLSHGVIKSYRATPGLYEWEPNPNGRPNPQLQLVSVLPKNSEGKELPLPEGKSEALAGRQPNLRHSISNDGTRVFWTRRLSAEENNLYLHETVEDPTTHKKTHETIQLDAVASGAGEGTPTAKFQTASTDGAKVFFTDTQRLTADSRAVAHPREEPDLYVYDVPTHKLTDLTPGSHGESANVLGQGGRGVIGTSDSGDYVYFVADGILAGGASRGSCSTGAGTCNLYGRHFNGSEWEATKMIAVLSSEDGPSWGVGGIEGDLKVMTSRVSPNGRYVAFMSRRSLTGYNNEDVTSKAPGERLDEEVFLYDAQAGSLVCASCNPSGARPAGVFDPGAAGSEVPGPESEGNGLVVDRSDIWGPGNAGVDHWLAGNVPGWTPVGLERAIYQSRYLLDNGRLFFNSPDHLVSAATGVKEKVYEYEPNEAGGAGGCHSQGGCLGLLSAPNNAGNPNRERESAFLDASAAGEDVFFLTAAKLSPGDGDSNFDVYDARACAQGSSSPSCLPPPALGSEGCKGDAGCKGAPRHAESFTAPAGPAVEVPAGVVAGTKEAGKPKAHFTRAQLLAKALKICRTKYKAKSKRKQRASCEARARKKYGPPSKHKASKHK